MSTCAAERPVDSLRHGCARLRSPSQPRLRRCGSLQPRRLSRQAVPPDLGSCRIFLLAREMCDVTERLGETFLPARRTVARDKPSAARSRPIGRLVRQMTQKK
jgi:hypothetical protein